MRIWFVGCAANTDTWLAAFTARSERWDGSLPRLRTRSCIGILGFTLRPADGSRMSCEVHVRFCEGLGLQCPGLLTATFGRSKAGFIPPWSCVRIQGRQPLY